MDFELEDVLNAIAENFDLDIDAVIAGGETVDVEDGVVQKGSVKDNIDASTKGDSEKGNSEDSVIKSDVSEDVSELFREETIMRDSGHNYANVIEAKSVIKQHVEENIEKTRPVVKSSMKIYKPVLTRNTISKFEYVAVITKLAKYLHALPTLPSVINDFSSDLKINNIINPAELAWMLLRKGVYNPVFDRGYEKVSFSELSINPTWDNLIENYFKSQHEAIEKELLNDMFAH